MHGSEWFGWVLLVVVVAIVLWRIFVRWVEGDGIILRGVPQGAHQMEGATVCFAFQVREQMLDLLKAKVGDKVSVPIRGWSQEIVPVRESRAYLCGELQSLKGRTAILSCHMMYDEHLWPAMLRNCQQETTFRIRGHQILAVNPLLENPDGSADLGPIHWQNPDDAQPVKGVVTKKNGSQIMFRPCGSSELMLLGLKDWMVNRVMQSPEEVVLAIEGGAAVTNYWQTVVNTHA